MQIYSGETRNGILANWFNAKNISFNNHNVMTRSKTQWVSILRLIKYAGLISLCLI